MIIVLKIGTVVTGEGHVAHARAELGVAGNGKDKNSSTTMELK